MPPKPGSWRRPKAWRWRSATRSPPSVPRTQQRVQRDFEEQVDRINVMVDFDGDRPHRLQLHASAPPTASTTASSPTRTQFNKDWDGNWQHAVGEDDGGLDGRGADSLVHRADARGQAATSARSKIYLDRVIGTTGERVAWPQASFERPRFLSDFAAIEVASYSQSLLAVTPYVSGLYDNVGEQQRRRRRRRHVLEAERPDAADRHRESGLRPGGERRPGGQLRAPPKPSSATSGRSSPRTRASSNSPRRRTSASCSTRAASAAPPTTARARATSPRRSSSTAASARPSTACSPPTKPSPSAARSARCAWCATSASRTWA